MLLRQSTKCVFLGDDGSVRPGNLLNRNSVDSEAGDPIDRWFSVIDRMRRTMSSTGFRRSQSTDQKVMADIVVEAKPSLTKSFDGAENKRTLTTIKNPFTSSTLSKTLNLGELANRRRRTRSKTAKTTVRMSAMSAFMDNKKSAGIRKRSDGLTPLQRFRKAARLVKLLVQVTGVCRDLLVYAIKDEQWYEVCEKYLNDASAGGTPASSEAFMTKIKNPVTKEYEQLEFDASQFRHDYHSGSVLTTEIKDILMKSPGTRTSREVEEAMLCVKKLVPCFKRYTHEQQKQICQLAMYDKYFQERVILREKLPPDGVYFVLNGTSSLADIVLVMESGAKSPTPTIIKPGDKFGEDELKVGVLRKSNVVSKSAVDLLYLHKFDYMDIFDLSVELGEGSTVFDVCKKELVFQYYPIQELVRNPAIWQVLKFKYGRLIANDSCDTEYIYVIRTGEARVIKCLKTKTINVAQRRRKLQAEMDSNDPYSSTTKLLNFVSNNALQTSQYNPKKYSPKRLPPQSAPIRQRLDRVLDSRITIQNNRPKTAKASISISSIEHEDSDTDDHENIDEDLSSFSDKDSSEYHKDEVDINAVRKENHARLQASASKGRTNQGKKSWAAPTQAKTSPLSSPGVLINREKTTPITDIYRQKKMENTKAVPPFVLVDSLRAGQTYGMRSLLSHEQRGSSAALVSAGCEVIQINKKFFSKHLDDNMLGIIALKAKAYPSEEELLKRLDVNLQWEEYCAGVMCTYLDSKVKSYRASYLQTGAPNT